MANEDLSIINHALVLIGAKTLASVSDNTKSARLAATLLETSRDEMMLLPTGRGDEREGWTFAMTRLQLTEHDESPAFGWENQFELPSNFLGVPMMVDVGGDRLEYPFNIESFVEEGGDEIRVLLTDESAVYIKYIRQLTDYGLLPVWFRKLVYIDLARKMSVPIRQAKTSTKEDRLAMWFEEAYAFAIVANQSMGARVNAEGRNLEDGNMDVVDAAQRGESITGPRIVER